MLFEYKGKKYEFITDTVRKCSITREWVGVVLYKSLEDNNIYVRDGEEFYSRFREVYQFKFPEKLKLKLINKNIRNETK